MVGRLGDRWEEAAEVHTVIHAQLTAPEDFPPVKVPQQS